jgi:hypothetical protein
MKSSQKNSKSGKTIYALVAEFDRIFTDTAQSLNLIKIELNKPKPNQIDILNHISDYYYNMIYARPMGNVNNSMFMNQINYLLKRS